VKAKIIFWLNLVVFSFFLVSCSGSLISTYKTFAKETPSEGGSESSEGPFRLSQVIRYTPSGSIIDTITFDYQEDERRIVMDIDRASSSTITNRYTFNEDSRLSAWTWVNQQDSNEPMTHTYLYDAQGRLEWVRMLYLLTTTSYLDEITYDSEGRVSSYEKTRRYDFFWSQEQITKHTVSSQSGDSSVYTYSYGSENRLSRLDYSTPSYRGYNTYYYNEDTNLFRRVNLYLNSQGLVCYFLFQWERGDSLMDFADIRVMLLNGLWWGWFAGPS